MNLIDKISKDAWNLRYEIAYKSNAFPEIAVYLGMSQRSELMANFASLRFMMAYRTNEEYTGNDWQIEGAKIYFVTKEDHYNVVQLNSPLANRKVER